MTLTIKNLCAANVSEIGGASDAYHITTEAPPAAAGGRWPQIASQAAAVSDAHIAAGTAGEYFHIAIFYSATPANASADVSAQTEILRVYATNVNHRLTCIRAKGGTPMADNWLTSEGYEITAQLVITADDQKLLTRTIDGLYKGGDNARLGNDANSLTGVRADLVAADTFQLGAVGDNKATIKRAAGQGGEQALVLPGKSGELALKSDIPNLDNYFGGVLSVGEAETDDTPAGDVDELEAGKIPVQGGDGGDVAGTLEFTAAKITMVATALAGFNFLKNPAALGDNLASGISYKAAGGTAQLNIGTVKISRDGDFYLAEIPQPKNGQNQNIVGSLAVWRRILKSTDSLWAAGSLPKPLIVAPQIAVGDLYHLNREIILARYENAAPAVPGADNVWPTPGQFLGQQWIHGNDTYTWLRTGGTQQDADDNKFPAVRWAQTKGAVRIFLAGTSTAGTLDDISASHKYQYVKSANADREWNWTDFARLYFYTQAIPSTEANQDQTSPICSSSFAFIAGEKVFTAEENRTIILSYSGASTFAEGNDTNGAIELTRIYAEF